jgi:hypothetical protein
LRRRSAARCCSTIRAAGEHRRRPGHGQLDLDLLRQGAGHPHATSPSSTFECRHPGLDRWSSVATLGLRGGRCGGRRWRGRPSSVPPAGRGTVSVAGFPGGGSDTSLPHVCTSIAGTCMGFCGGSGRRRFVGRHHSGVDEQLRAHQPRSAAAIGSYGPQRRQARTAAAADARHAHRQLAGSRHRGARWCTFATVTRPVVPPKDSTE